MGEGRLDGIFASPNIRLTMRAIRRFNVRTVLPQPLLGLGELAGNLRWSWDSETLEIFRAIDPAIFESVNGDPMRVLSDVPSSRLNELAANTSFVNRVEAARASLHNYLNRDSWYRGLGDRAPRAIGYFSA